MQAWRIAAAFALVALCRLDGVVADDDSDHPGICEDTTDCTTKDYECVALQTTRADTETVKQCLPKKVDTDVCSGQYPGMCPTFSSWVSPYNTISSVCTYIPTDECAKDPTGSSVEGELICVSGAVDQDGKTIDVIYGCVDFDTSANQVLFGEDESTTLASKLGTPAALLDGCMDASTSSLLCSGQGTCVPEATASLNYTCHCNVGYNGTYCDGVESNKCQLPGQCAAGVCNLTTQECECEEGTTGNQCSMCDATSSKACNGHGACGLDGSCECDDGWQGLQCTKEIESVNAKVSTSSSKDTADVGSDSKSGSNAATGLSTRLASATVVVSSLLAIALFH